MNKRLFSMNDACNLFWLGDIYIPTYITVITLPDGRIRIRVYLQRIQGLHPVTDPTSISDILPASKYMSREKVEAYAKNMLRIQRRTAIIGPLKTTAEIQRKEL